MGSYFLPHYVPSDTSCCAHSFSLGEITDSERRNECGPSNTDILRLTASLQRGLPRESGRQDVLLAKTTRISKKSIYHLFYSHKFTVLLEKRLCHIGYEWGWLLRLKGSGNPPALSMTSGPLLCHLRILGEKAPLGL